MARFVSIEEMIAEAAVMVRPPERLRVSEAAERIRYLNNSGSYVGYWNNKIAPYLVEPMDTTQSLDFTGMVFVGPARTGKSDMFFNWMGYTAKYDPADMLLYHMTQASARDWSIQDLGKVFRHSKQIGELLSPGRQNDNVHDKAFRSGMRLLIKWPTINEMSGKTTPRLWLMDYDRMTQDVDGEGNPYDLARKRAQTFRRFGMCVAESSPGYVIEDPKWLAKTPHEAPPTGGILALYNRGDRRRWQWRCPQCDGAFEPDFNLFSYPKCDDHMEAAEQVVMVCPHNSCVIEPHFKQALNEGGRWIKDGQIWLPDGTIAGKARRTDIASFWMKGPAAAFQDWKSLVLKYLQAVEEFEKTGKEEALKATTNTDQGHPYLPKALESGRLPEHLKARARDYGGTADEPVVPRGVRFLIATVDVQARAFVVQVHGFGVDGEMWIVDMFKIRKSERLDDSGERHILDPAGYVEDWRVLLPQVIEKTYPLADGSGRRMAIKATGCDSGGREGVTTNAYNFWRWLRDEHGDRGLHTRFQLLKGESKPSRPRAYLTFPDSQRKDRFAGARGDIPVLMLNSNMMKDQVHAMLGREEDGGGKVNFPEWAPDWFYAQLTAEVRTPKGWENPAGRRNEAWDLLYYAVGVSLNARQISPIAEKIDWSNPPTWAAEWDKNDLVLAPEVNFPFDSQHKSDISLEELAAELA